MSLLRTDEEILLLHNPRCSKSRAVRALLEERGVSFETRQYLDAPLSEAELGELASRIGRPIGEWVRRREGAWSESGLTDGASDAEISAAVAKHPILMERPIVVRGERAVVGRPPEGVLDLL